MRTFLHLRFVVLCHPQNGSAFVIMRAAPKTELIK